MNRAMFFCTKCDKLVEIINEEYLEPIVEKRIWNGKTYELVESNIADIEYKHSCGVCGEDLYETEVIK